MYEALRSNAGIHTYSHSGTRYSSRLRQRLQGMWVETRHARMLANGELQGLMGLAP
jgi:hypothetical protein